MQAREKNATAMETTTTAQEHVASSTQIFKCKPTYKCVWRIPFWNKGKNNILYIIGNIKSKKSWCKSFN